MGRFLFLGTGASTGVPIIGCHCNVCSSTFFKNRRLRPSGIVEWEGKRFVIDAGPDFRQQALTHRIETIDALLLTHTHFDHIAGIDDFRVYSFRTKQPVPCLLSFESLEILKVRYRYLFGPHADLDHAQMEFRVAPQEGSVSFEGVTFHTFSYVQAKMSILGFRFGKFAYVSDIRVFNDSIFKALDGVDTLVVSALRSSPSALHFNVEEAVQFSRTVRAKRTWLTHISHQLDHELTERDLPPDIRLGYDGHEFFFE